MANIRDYQSYLDTPILPHTASTARFWQHQVAMVTFASSMPHALLYAGMSTGKTLAALRYLEQFKGLRLVLSPAKPMPVYAEDYETFYTNGKPFNLYVMDSGTSKAKAKELERLAKSGANAVVVLSYSTAYRLPLHKYNFTAAVADECHRLGIYNSKQSMQLARTCAAIPRKMGMSGTPFHDARERLYGIYRWFDPILFKGKRPYPQAKLFGHYNNFLAEYCVTRQHRNVPIIVGYKNTEQLLDLIKPTTLQIKTEDVIDLPALVIREHKTPLTRDTRKAYDMLKDDAIIPFDDDAVIAPHVLTRVTRLQQLIASGELVSDAGEMKLFDITSRQDKLSQLITELEGQPVVVFTRFKRDVEVVRATLNSLYPRAGVSLLTGSTDEHEQWKQGRTQYLIANVSAGSEGIRLTRAQHIIVWSLSYSLKSFEQLIARVRRYGQKSDRVFVHIITSENTVDGDILQALQCKSKQVDQLDEGLKV